MGWWRWLCNDNEFIKWYDGYKKRKAQKAQIKEEFLLIAWHPYRVMDWCVSEDEKKERKIAVIAVFCPKKNDILSLKIY